MRNDYFKELLACLGVAVLIVVFYCCAMLSFMDENYKPTTRVFQTTLQIDSLTAVTKLDTVSVAMYVAKVDSIAKVTSDIDKHYQDDINLMINKTSHWMAFWLGLLTIFAGFIGLLHYFRSRRYDEDFHGKLKDIDSAVDKMNGKVDEKIKESNKKVSDSINESNLRIDEKIKNTFIESDEKFMGLNKDLQRLSEDIKKSEKENRINTLMTCISSFPDPSMFSSTPRRRQFIQFYLNKLCREFNEYIKIVKAKKSDDLTENDYNRLSLVLSSVKYVVIRTQSNFSGYHQNVTFNRLKDAINKMLIEIVDQGEIKGDLSKRLDEVLLMFKVMVYEMSK